MSTLRKTRLSIWSMRLLTVLSLVLSVALPVSPNAVQAQSNPNFSARLTENQVHGYEWPLGASVTLTIDDPANGAGVDYTDTQTVIVAPWNPQGTFVQFNLGQNFDLQAGQVVALTDSLTTKTHTVTSLAVTAADPTTDTVSGTADPGSDVWVNACDNNGCVDRHEVADGGGNWTANFAVPGDEDWETATYDIGPGSGGEARQNDDDGDMTQHGWHVPNPYIEVSAGSRWAHAREWPTGALITMTIDDPDNGPGVDYTATATMGQAPWNPSDPNDIVADFALGTFVLQPGQLVTMTDGVTAKTLTITQLAATSADPQTETVSGLGTPGVQIQVCANLPNRCVTRWVTPDESGHWTANYAVPGVSPDDPDTVDLQPGSSGWASEYEADSDRTWADWRVPNPIFAVWPVNEHVEGWEWPLGATVTLTIDDSDPNNGIVYTDSQVVNAAPWDPNQTYFNFNLWSLVNVQLGQVVTVTDGATVKTHTVQLLTYDRIDYDTDIGAGTASPNAPLQVSVGGPNFGRTFDITADASGDWLMNYGAQGIDVTPQNWVNAQINDEDGDRSQAAPWGGGIPRLNASLEFDWINIGGFTPNGQVTYTIYDYEGGHALFGPITGPVDPHGNGNLDNQVHRTDMVPGNVITAVDEATGTIKSLTMREIKFDVMDTQTDVAAGFSEPDAVVTLNVSERFDYGYSIETVADGSGNWSVDLGALGHDLSGYWWVTANLIDDDGDEVVAEAPRLEADVVTDHLSIHHFTRNASATVEIYDAPGGNLIFGPLTLPANRMGEAWFNGRDYGVDFTPGQYIVVTDDALLYAKELLLEPVTFEELNVDQDYARGTANVGRRMTIHLNGPFSHYGLNPVVDQNGNWFADYGAAGYDLTESMWGSAWVQDDNMDVTYANTTPPPTVTASAQSDWVNGYNFTPNGEVLVEVYESSNTGIAALRTTAANANLIYSGIHVADGNTNLNVNLRQYGVDLQPSHYVVATDLTSNQTTDLTLVPVTFDYVDYDADVAGGTAEPGAWVTVYADRPFEHYELAAIAEADGNWVVDFGARGVDLTSDMNFNARVYDANGDSTQADAPRPPVFTASLTNDGVWGNNWTPDSEVQIEVYETEGGALLAGPFTFQANSYGDFWADLWQQGVDLQAGQYLAVADTASGKSKATTLINLTFDSIDFDQDIAYGTAPADTRLRVGLGNQMTWEEFDFFSEADGHWAADFGAHNVDLTPDMWGNARIYDDDGDATQNDWSNQYPMFEAWPVDDRIQAYAWPLEATVTLTIDDPVTPALPDYTTSGTVTTAPWDSRQRWVSFELNGIFDLAAGHAVTLTDGATVKTHAVAALTITALDPNTDTITGTAAPGAEVFVDVWAPNGASRRVIADAAGNWTANFAVPGDEGFESNTFDLVPDSNGVARQPDADADVTIVYWRAPNPVIAARPFEWQVSGYGWPLGALVTMTIDDPATPASPDYTDTVESVMQSWGQAEAWFDLLGRFTLKPGHIVTMTDGATTKMHLVTRLMATTTDPDADRVHGMAEPNDMISIYIWDPSGNTAASRDIPVDGDGNWIADFTVPIDGQTYDIVDGTSFEANEVDEDNDTTNFRWQVPYIPVCLAGATVTGTVVGPEGAPINDATIHFDDFDTGEPLFITNVGANAAYGCSLPDGNYRIWANGGGYSREYYGETIFENAARVQVTAGVEYANVNFTLDTPSVTYDHLTFNMTDPVVGDLAVRQAIAYGTDRSRIIAATYPYSPTWDTYLPPDHWAHATRGVPQYDFDPQQARNILTAAGWVDEDGDGVRENDGVRLHIVYVTTHAALRATVSQIFVENMADLGIEIEVQALPPSEMFGSGGALERHEFGITQFAWANDVNDDAFPGTVFDSQSASNFGLYNNPAADQLLVSAQTASTRAEKRPYLRQHQALVMADLATLPLFQRVDTPPLGLFVVLGQEGARLDQHTLVVSGDVGASIASAGPYLGDQAEVTIGNYVYFNDPKSRVMGDTVYLKQGAQVYDVYYNEISGKGEVRGYRFTPIDLPLVPRFPAVPTVTPGSQNFNVPVKGTLTLAAGNYGALKAKQGATIIFTGGVYNFQEWNLGPGARVYFKAPTEIRIAGRLKVEQGSYIGPAPSAAKLGAADIYIYALGQNGNTGKLGAYPKAATFGVKNTLIANVYVPNGTLLIGEKSTATGAFLGKWVDVGQKVVLTLASGWR